MGSYILQAQIFVDSKLEWGVTCYEIFTRCGVVRLVADKDEWRWAPPFERDDPVHANAVPFASVDHGVNVLELKVDPASFRRRGLVAKDKKGLRVLMSSGEYREMGMVDPPPNYNMGDNSVFIPIDIRKYDTGVAFTVRTYHWKSTRPTGWFAKGKEERKTWQWVSSVIVPWKALIAGGEHEVGFQTFQWSDVRLDIREPSHEILVVRKFGKFNESYVPPPVKIQDALELRLPGDMSQEEHEEATRAIVLSSSTPNLIADMIRVSDGYVVPEFYYMRKVALRHGRVGYDNAVRCAQGTLGLSVNGLQYDMRAKLRSGNVPWEYFGVSMQSWFVYTTPAATPQWFLARLAEVQRLHDYYGSSFEEDVALIVKGGEMKTDVRRRLRRRLTDVVRLVTMHSVTRPYIPDHVDVDDAHWIMSDTYSPGLAIPGDCEDGAQAAYLLYMTLLFGEYHKDVNLSREERKKLELLRSCAAICGVPMGVTGTSFDPIGNTDGESHAFGVVIPFDTYVKAMFGEDALPRAMELFKERYGFEYPSTFFQRPKVLETTVFCTTSYEEHAPQDTKVTKAVHEWAAAMQEMRPVWTNTAIVFENNEDSACHNYLIRAYGSYNREFFPAKEFIPTLLEGGAATEHSCSFVFCVENGEVGITRDEFFHDENRREFALRVPVAMSKEAWDAERNLLLDVDRPVVPLIPIVEDPYKNEDRVALYDRHDDTVPSGARRLHVFVYDINYVYPDGVPTVGKLNALLDTLTELGFTKYVIRPYGFCHAIIYF